MPTEPSTGAVTAIFVPSELEEEVSEWLKRRYSVCVLQGSGDTSGSICTSQTSPDPVVPRSKKRRVKTAAKEDVWSRLAAPRTAASGVPSGDSLTDCQRKEKSQTKRRTVQSGDVSIHERLYAAGLSQKERQQRAAEEARKKREEEEESHMRRGAVLSTVLSRSENHNLSGKALENKMVETALRGRSSSASSESGASPDRFRQLYLDGEARERKLDELRDRYREKEKRVLNERRMRE